MKREFSAGGIVFKKLQEVQRFHRQSERKNINSNSVVKVLFLLTKSSVSELFPNSIWRLPKGWIDDVGEGKNPGPIASGERKATEEELQSSALREVREEAGVEATVIKKIGTETYFLMMNDERIMKFVTFYLMEWIADLPEGFGFETSEVGWFEFDEAKKILKSGGEKKMLEKAMSLLSLK